MPKRKKLPTVPDYVDGGRSVDKLLVQKSNPLQSLSETSMTLSELKILDVYLARINSHEPDKRYVRFEKGELEKLLGVVRIPKEELSKRLDNLFQVITIRDEHKRKGFTKIALFEKAEATQSEDGLWQVELICTPSAMEYIFNVEDLGYLSYLLRNVIDLTSRYSYILYLYLENNKFRREWTISIGELKQLLRCTAERYTEFKFFNSEILKKCHKEINEKTNLQYEYEPIKSKGRKIAEIGFKIITQDVQLTFFDLSEPEDAAADPSENYKDSYLGFLAEACKFEFSEPEMDVLTAVMVDKGIGNDRRGLQATQLARYDYLRKIYIEMCAQAARNSGNGKPIKDRFKYFKTMLERD